MSQDPRQFLEAYELDGNPFIAFVRAAAENGRLIMVTSPGGAHHSSCICAICKIQDEVMKFTEDDLDFFTRIGVKLQEKEEKVHA